MLNSVTDDSYKISLIETKTYNVINEVENGYCDIGIIAIKNTDFDIMKRILLNKKLNFTSVLKTSPHVFVRKEHPVCNHNTLTYTDLVKYPFVSYEQGKHNISFFTEEIKSSIVDSVTSGEDDPLIGLGVMFEILWNNSSSEEQEMILNNIKKGM